MLFQKEHIGSILSGRKTQTRRLGKKRWNIGSVHPARTSRFSSPFAYLKILSVESRPLLPMSREDAFAEGYESTSEYLEAWRSIYHSPYLPLKPVWVITFEKVEKHDS